MLNSAHQHTLATKVTITGIGVHSGAPVILTIGPAPTSAGIAFVRTDITHKRNMIPARWFNVTDTKLCTVISNNEGVSVSTIEHLMSAFAACGVDNAFVEINGPEVPIMDGSAAAFIKAIDEAGVTAQNALRRVLRIRKKVTWVEDGKEVSLSPAEGQFFSFEIDFPNKLIGNQRYTHVLNSRSYRNDIAGARTFGFLHEVEALRKMGLARGGSLDNAIVIKGDTVMNKDGLRFQNEFVRHKILDAIGDIYLAGAQLVGQYSGVKAGHALNNKILHVLFSQVGAYDFVDITEPLPIRASAGSRVSVAAVAAAGGSRLSVPA